MLADQDHPLEDAIAGATPDPKLVIVYRTRGVPLLLIPPLLLLAGVSAIVVYRRSERPEPHPFLAARQVLPSGPSAGTAASDTPIRDAPRPAADGRSRVDALSELAEATGLPASVAPSSPEGPRYDPTLSAPARVEAPTQPAPVPPGATLAGERASTVASKEVLPEPRPASPAVTTAVPSASTPGLAGAPVEAKPTAPAPFDPPVVAGQKPDPAPPADSPLPPAEPPRRDRVGFDPEATRAALDAEPKPPPDRPDADRTAPPPAADPPSEPLALDPPRAPRAEPKADPRRAQRTQEAEVDIQAEAERKLALRIQLEAMKPGLLKPDPLEIVRRRDEFKAATRRLVAKDRPIFHGELSQLIKEYGRGAGPDIKALRERYGVDSIPEIVVPANRDLTGVAARLTTTERIRRMRQWGLPETMILDDLFDKEFHDIGSRGGPRNEDEAMVFAARVLLRHPPPIPRTSPPTAESAPAGR